MISLARMRIRLLPGQAGSNRWSSLFVAILLLGLGLALGHAALASPVGHDDCHMCQVLDHGGIVYAVMVPVLLGTMLPLLPSALCVPWQHARRCTQPRAPPLSL